MGVGVVVHDAVMGWTCEFDAQVWEWESSPEGTAWFFISVPEDESEDIRMHAGPPRGFGSVRVEATIGATTWRTSVFPGKSGYSLPVKKAVRRAESLDLGDSARVTLELI